MKKYFLVFLCAAISLAAIAQQDISRYLEGVVPEVKGKVVFTKSIPVKAQVSDSQLFSLMEKWAKQNYEIANDPLQNRILLMNAEDKNIACLGEKYLVFQNSALSLDRAEMSYQLILEVGSGKCDVTIRNIKYNYSGNKDIALAENTITDKVALNKNKDKLNRYYDKFRIHTVDSVNSIFRAIDVYLNGVNTVGAVNSEPVRVAEAQPVMAEAPIVAPAAVITPAISVAASDESTTITPQPMTGYKQIAPDKIPGNVIKLLSDAMLITSGTDGQNNVMAASWGGFGRFWEKPVAFCFLNPTRYSVQTMDKGETYTLSFYTEAYKENVLYCASVSGRNADKIKNSGLTLINTPSGTPAFGEAWMIIECRKIVAQQISPDAVVAKDLPSDWTKNGFHKMYIGEILNVWIK